MPDEEGRNGSAEQKADGNTEQEADTIRAVFPIGHAVEERSPSETHRCLYRGNRHGHVSHSFLVALTEVHKLPTVLSFHQRASSEALRLRLHRYKPNLTHIIADVRNL